MSGKMTKFKDLLVDTPNRYTVNGEVKTIVFSPNTITQEGTKDKAEYFNEMQKNGLYNVNATRAVEGTVEFYDIAIEGSDIFDVFDTQFIINFNETNTKLNPILRFNNNNYYIRFIENFTDIDVTIGYLQKTYIGFLDSANNKLKLMNYERKLTFDTVEDMQTATWLVEGDIVELLGYSTKRYGNHKRIISSANNGTGIQVGSNFAIITEKEIHISWIGDDLSKLNSLENGTVVYFDSKDYLPSGGTGTLIQKGIRLVGAKKPKLYEDLTKLVDGTVIKGTLLADSDNFMIENIGVDCGDDFTDTYNNGNCMDGLVIHNIAQTGTLNQNNHVKNCIGLCRIPKLTEDPKASVHAVLLESLANGTAYDITGVGGWYGVVFKVKDFNCDVIVGKENDSASVYIKSNSYGSVERVNIGKITTSNFSARGYVGCIIQSSDAEMSTVNVESIINYGGIYGTHLNCEVTQPIKNVNISKITTIGTASEGFKATGAIYNSLVSNININKPTNGVGVSTGANGSGQIINSLHLDNVIVDVDGDTNGVSLSDNVSFGYIKSTKQYILKGKINVAGGTKIVDYFGILNCNLTNANLLNNWKPAYGTQPVGSITKNGVTKFYGRLKITGQTGAVIFNLHPNCRQPNTEYYSSALIFDGSNNQYKTPVPVLIATNGDVSIPSYASLTGSWIELNSIEILTDIGNVSGAV